MNALLKWGRVEMRSEPLSQIRRNRGVSQKLNTNHRLDANRLFANKALQFPNDKDESFYDIHFLAQMLNPFFVRFYYYDWCINLQRKATYHLRRSFELSILIRKLKYLKARNDNTCWGLILFKYCIILYLIL